MTANASEVSIVVAKSEDIPEGGRLVVDVGGMELGIFRVRGRLCAYENYCAHRGGPVCQGMVIGRVEEILDEEKQTIGERFSEHQIHIVCPWHGYEYDLETGRHPGDPTVRLKEHVVAEREGEISVRL